MPGGAECRAFFSRQAVEFANGLTDELPVMGLTEEEMAAGWEDFFKAFGFYGTLDRVARYVGQDDEVVAKWSVRRFYTKLKLLSWRAYYEKRYQKILKDSQSGTPPK